MWQSSSCHVQQAQDGIKDTNLRRKHPEKNICVQPSNPPRNCCLSSKKDSPFKASMCLARLQGFSTSNGGYVWYQAALEQPQWRNEGHRPGSLEMDTSGHSKATVKKKTSRKATSMCPTLPEIAACPARKIRPERLDAECTRKSMMSSDLPCMASARVFYLERGLCQVPLPSAPCTPSSANDIRQR